MVCLERIKVNLVTHEVFVKTTNLYFEMGRNDYYQELFIKDLKHFHKTIAIQNAKSFFKIFFNDHKIKESRYKSLIFPTSRPNNKSEELYRNIYFVFERIHGEATEPFGLFVAEINDLHKLLFSNVFPNEKLKFRSIGKNRLFGSNQVNSMREELEKYLHELDLVKREKVYEPIFLYLNFLVDFINLEVFDLPYNDALGVLMYYILMIENGMHVFNYLSFFDKLQLYKEDFFEILEKVKVQAKQGLPDLMPLMKFFINIFNSMYLDLAEMARDYQYDLNLEINKTDYIENTVNKLSEVFSKEDIRKRHPSISDSTINRTLKRLQEEGLIRAVGKGRHAKWIRIVKKDKKKKFDGQISFDLGE